jgi:SNF2 family DNA or RNA helicase
MEAKYTKGQPVQIISTGEVVTINDISKGFNGMFYFVFQNGKKVRIKESDLAPYVDTESAILEDFNNQNFGNADQFLQFIYYYQFSEKQESNIYSYQGNKIIFNPFQYKPLLKFLSPESDERLLIADEVGVGKTIEAGIIMDELLARHDLEASDTILVVCPNILCYKWKQELRKKFQLDDFEILDGKNLAAMLEELKDKGKTRYNHNIVSEQLFRGEKYQLLLEETMEKLGEAFIKLLIVDECHHYRNAETNTHKLGELLSSCSARVVMLSATPFNLRSDDLFNQLNMLNPVLFPDVELFNQLTKQIQNVNQAIVQLRKNTTESRACLTQILNMLKPVAEQNTLIEDSFNRMYLAVVDDVDLSIPEIVTYEKTLNMLNPIATSFTRTLKRDAIAHRVTREVKTLQVNFTKQESDIYQAFLDVNMLRHRMRGVSERAFGLIINGLERIAASSIPALEKNIYRFMHQFDSELEDFMENDYQLNKNSLQEMRGILSEEYNGLLHKIHSLNGVDTKYTLFRELIQNVWDTILENPRVVVFSFYIGTLKYLRKKLSADGYRVAIMYGDTPFETPKDEYDEEGYPIIGRNDIIKAFEAGQFDILLASEVGGEGLDFQFCTSLINYDLPYNPMRIEQRIGRIDRMGQKSDKIIIGNLCVSGTVDEVINRVLLSRIADATDLIGDLEPIIAQEMQEINDLIIRKEFTPEQLEKRQQEIEAQIEKARAAREEFDVSRYDLVNDKGFRDEFEVDIRRSRICPRDSFAFTVVFLKNINGCWSKALSETALQIHLTKDIRNKMRSYYLNLDMGKAGKELKDIFSTEGDVIINFSGNEAYENQDHIFVKPCGAFVSFMLEYIKTFEANQTQKLFHVAVKEGAIETLAKGTFLAFAYEYKFKGFHDNCITSYVMVNFQNGTSVDLTEDEWKKLFINLQGTKKEVSIDSEVLGMSKTLADDLSEMQLDNLRSELMGNNDIKLVSRIEAIKVLSRLRISKKEGELLGASPKDAERIRKAIQKEMQKTEESVQILEEKRKFVSSAEYKALCIVEVV